MEGNQRVVRNDGITVFEADYFSGPFASPEGSGFMVSVPGEILLMDTRGSVVKSWITGEYPGSLASGDGTVWFVSSRDGSLKKLDTIQGSVETVPLSFTPLTVQYCSEMLLIESSQDEYSLCTTEGEEIRRIEGGFGARFSENRTITICRWDETEGCRAISWKIVEHSVDSGVETSRTLEAQPLNCPSAEQKNPEAHFDVPYMHQRWDTPNWFNGSWSCGPTSCMMAVQYYNRLTPDSIWCSSPSGHWSEWGNYIPVEYTFLGCTYDVLGVSPGSVWVPGAHGFICRDIGGAYWSYMVIWMEQHGLESSDLGTTWSACTTELSGSWPVVASTRSVYTNGHILLFNGYYQNHSVICNDSYGNQNLPGWGSYSNGKDVVYDWPGYNNGNTELIVRQLFRARSQVLSPAGTLVDDRTHGYRKLGPCQYWHEQSTGYQGYSWWTYSTGALPDTCVVEWTPELSTAGMYTIETWIPSSHAGATGIYRILTQSGWETACLNQGNYSNQWATLGTWHLNPSTAMVKMGDYTGTQGQYISFDAVRFILETSVAEESISAAPGEFSIQANPVSYSSAIGFTTPENFSGDILVYDTAGREVARSTGTLWAETLSPGIYFAVISHQGQSLTARFTVTR